MAAADDSLIHLLRFGGDERTIKPYGVSVPAQPGLICLGSCTANPMTPEMLNSARALQESDAWIDPRASLRVRFGAADCLLAASGTDTEYSVALSMDTQTYTVLLMDPREVGTGTLNAAQGLPHTQGGFVTQSLGLQIQAQSIALRDKNGNSRPLDQVDQDTLARAKHVKGSLLVHHVPCTKTGLCAPSENACREIIAENANARIVVDNVQARHQPGDIERWISWGWAVMMSGSKFLGAPPFCGATLFPKGWHISSSPAARSNCPGVRARWRLALNRLDADDSTEQWIQIVNATLVQKIGKDRFDHLEITNRRGIFAFDLGLSFTQTQSFHHALIDRGFFIGQAVRAGERALLRVAPGAGMDMGKVGEDLDALGVAIESLTYC